MTKKGLEKKKKLIAEALQYRCLRADIEAANAAIAENQPLQVNREAPIFKRLVGELIAQFENAPRAQMLEMLEKKKAEAEKALASFAGSKKAIELSNNPEALCKLMDKSIFKKDKNGGKRIGFALAFMLTASEAYQYPQACLASASELLFGNTEYMGELRLQLQKNYRSITAQEETQVQSVVRIFYDVLSDVREAMPSWAIDLFTLRGKLRFTHGKRRAESLLEQNENAFLAMQLTVLSEIKNGVDSAEWSVLADGLLKEIGNLRADAEYIWVIEGQERENCKARIAVYDRAVARLATIAGS